MAFNFSYKNTAGFRLLAWAFSWLQNTGAESRMQVRYLEGVLTSKKRGFSALFSIIWCLNFSFSPRTLLFPWFLFFFRSFEGAGVDPQNPPCVRPCRCKDNLNVAGLHLIERYWKYGIMKEWIWYNLQWNLDNSNSRGPRKTVRIIESPNYQE